MSGRVLHERTLMTEDDLYLFNEGSHFSLWKALGSRLTREGGRAGARFGVWAPNAEAVSVIGDFNAWSKGDHPLAPLGESGIWEGFVPDVDRGARYKYHIVSRERGYRVDKADPVGIYQETPPATGSVVWDLEYEWGDEEWMQRRDEANAGDRPISVYEVHLGSWRRVPEEGNRPLTYRETAPALAQYVRECGFTHVEFLPVMEHPFYGSWGYQTTGYFAPTSRYGSPQDFMFLIDHLHRNGIGVILDWVPSHFPTDEHGLAFFDGTHLYEHSDPREGFHPDWKSNIFNYGRHEVRSFLISSASFWLDVFHADGLRVDAVASMLYRDYSRAAGEWIPNRFGGRENLEALALLRRLNEAVYAANPDIQMIAEESTAWPMVSRPTHVGGLGFGMKWDMGWMHDTLQYLQREAVHRSFHHDELTFRMVYAFNENFMLPLSHDEVVHGKGSLLRKMPGDEWQKMATLRALMAYMWSLPGKKLLFMGCEFGQWNEWAHEEALAWHLLERAPHAGLRLLIGDLNRLYREEPALHELDFQPAGFEWVEASDAARSVFVFLRKAAEVDGGRRLEQDVMAVLNFTPVPLENYRLGVDGSVGWREILNTDATEYGGSGWGNLGELESTPVPSHGRSHSLLATLPPLGAVLLKRRSPERRKA